MVRQYLDACCCIFIISSLTWGMYIFYNRNEIAYYDETYACSFNRDSLNLFPFNEDESSEWCVIAPFQRRQILGFNRDDITCSTSECSSYSHYNENRPMYGCYKIVDKQCQRYALKYRGPSIITYQRMIFLYGWEIFIYGWIGVIIYNGVHVVLCILYTIMEVFCGRNIMNVSTHP